MATGRSTKLTGAIGEFLVSAELCRRGLIATPFSGNVPHYDIIASDEKGGHLLVQVKTINNENWQFDASKFVDITMDGDRQLLGSQTASPCPNLFCVFVALEKNSAKDRYFVFSWENLVILISSGHKIYLEKHNGIRPRAPKSTHCSINIKTLEPFENRWDFISNAISQQHAG